MTMSLQVVVVIVVLVIAIAIVLCAALQCGGYPCHYVILLREVVSAPLPDALCLLAGQPAPRERGRWAARRRTGPPELQVHAPRPSAAAQTAQIAHLSACWKGLSSAAPAAVGLVLSLPYCVAGGEGFSSECRKCACFAGAPAAHVLLEHRCCAIQHARRQPRGAAGDGARHVVERRPHYRGRPPVNRREETGILECNCGGPRNVSPIMRSLGCART